MNRNCLRWGTGRATQEGTLPCSIYSRGIQKGSVLTRGHQGVCCPIGRCAERGKTHKTKGTSCLWRGTRASYRAYFSSPRGIQKGHFRSISFKHWGTRVGHGPSPPPRGPPVDRYIDTLADSGCLRERGGDGKTGGHQLYAEGHQQAGGARLRALYQCFMHPNGQFWCIFFSNIGGMKCGPD